jgi:drug/metabolite transporter (DMT)-like permease
MQRQDSESSLETHRGKWLRLHPLSGVAILLLDNLFFGLKAMTAGLGMPITATLAFWTTLFAVWFVQRKLAHEDRRMSFGKALGAGIIAGLPFSIAGTVIGSWVILSAGLSPWRRLTKLRR